MAIQYSGLTIRNDVHTGITDYRYLLDAINTTLVAAGWTSTELSAFNTISYTGVPSNNDFIDLPSGTVYTFKTAINNANVREVLIGADGDSAWANLVACVTGGAGSGTLYSSATITNTVVTASVEDTLPTGSVKVTTLTAGPDGNGLCFDEYANTVANAEFAYYGDTNANTFTAFGGYKWTSVATPAGLKCNVIGWLRAANISTLSGSPADFSNAMFILTDASGIAICPSTYLRSGAFSIGGSDDFDDTGARVGLSTTLPTTTWRVIANGYQFFCMGNTVYSATNPFISAGVPWIPSYFYPKVVTAATTASPIVITTSTDHGWTTGDAVCVDGVNGISGANGNFTVTVLSSTTASLGGSIGSGTYTSGGVAAELNTGLASCAWMMGCGGVSGSATIPLYTAIGPSNWVGQVLNGSINAPRIADGGGTNYGSGTAALILPSSALNASVGDPLVWYNTDVLATEPLLGMGTSNSATFYLVGQLWDSFFHSKAEAGGTLGTFDSKNWYILTNQATGSSTTKEGALVLRVP